MTSDSPSFPSGSVLVRVAASILFGAATFFLVLNGQLESLKLLWPDYASAAPTRAYTLPMLFTRLVVFGLAIVATSCAVCAIARDRRMAWVAGAIVFAFSFPAHALPGEVWDAYPPWYHYSYLVSIVPLAWLGGQIFRD